jgi:hypothetical protein
VENSGTGTGPAWVPSACTLPTAEQPLRVADFGAFLAGAVRAVQRIQPTRLRLDLEPSPQTAGRAGELAMAESECCSFFTFALTASGGGLVLDIAVPPQQAGVLDALARHAAAAAGPGQ